METKKYVSAISPEVYNNMVYRNGEPVNDESTWKVVQENPSFGYDGEIGNIYSFTNTDDEVLEIEIIDTNIPNSEDTNNTQTTDEPIDNGDNIDGEEGEEEELYIKCKVISGPEKYLGMTVYIEPVDGKLPELGSTITLYKNIECTEVITTGTIQEIPGEDPEIPSKPEPIENTPEEDATSEETVNSILTQIEETGKAANVTIPEGETLANITIPETVTKGMTINAPIENGATIRNESTQYMTINNTGEAVDIVFDTKGESTNGTVYPKGEYNNIYTDAGLQGSSSTYATVNGDITIDENCNAATTVSVHFTEGEHTVATESDFGGKVLTISNTKNSGQEQTTPNLEVVAPNASVTVNGFYDEVEVTCSDSTLKLGTNFKANKLTLRKGRIYLECLPGCEPCKIILMAGATLEYATTEITASNLTGLTGSSVFKGKATVIEDIELTNKNMALGILASGEELLDLNGHIVKMGRNDTGCLYLRGSAIMNITDSSEAGTGELVNNSESYGVWTGAQGNIVNIYGGTFKAYTHVMYAYLGEINIYGGEFIMLGENADKDSKGHYKFLLNCYDANYTAGTAKINVYGGKYHNFDPSDAYGEPGAPISYVAEGYESICINEEQQIYEVRPVNQE